MKPHPRFLPRLAAGLFTLTAAGAMPVVLSLISLAPASARAAAEEGEITFDSFYQNLADNGDWYETAEFGYVFQPYIAYKNESWRPYTDGYWAQTDQGWTWVSYEDFGWACYHYGRWTQLENTGWVWVPGYEWGPGWVSWRTSDDYIGWAPLPPKVTRSVATTTVQRTGGASVVDEGRTFRPEDLEEDYDTGYNAGVDAQYDIGPGNYSFVPVHSFGAPYLAEAVVPVAQNIVIIEGTTNVTNIVYRRGTRGDRDRVIYCGGPDYNLVSRRVERPIPRLLLERRPFGVDNSGPRPRGDRFSAVRENRLEVFAPSIVRPGAAGFVAGRPPRIKETLDRPQIVHGWRNFQQQDPRAADRLRERFQQQARQAPPARQVVESFVSPTAFRAQPPPPIQEQQRQHQPPPPRTAEGNRLGGGNRPLGANPPATVPAVIGPQPGIPSRPGPGNARGPQGRPAVEPNPAAGVQPVPGPGGRNLSDVERQARRDARQREMEQRQGNRPPSPQPGSVPAAPPNVVNPGNPATPPATAPGRPADRPNRTAEERDAYRAAKQAEKAREDAAARPNQQPPAGPPRDPNAERTREDRRPVPRPREQQPPATPVQPAQPQPDAAREQRRAARQQEEQAQRAAQQQQQQQAGERGRAAQDQQQQQQQREQRRAARQQEEQQQAQRGAQQQQQQAAERARAQQLQVQQQQLQQQQGAERARAAQEQQREQRRAERQQQAAPPQPRQAASPEARPPAAAPAQPGQPTEEELRKRKRGENAPR